jgi:hypothetical protein
MISIQEIIRSVPPLIATLKPGDQATLEEMLLAGRGVIQEVRPSVLQYLEHSNEMGVPPALPGRHAKFDRYGSPSKKLQA